MMGKQQRSIVIAKALMMGATGCVVLGLGLGGATPAFGDEEAVERGELSLDAVEAPATTVADWMAQIETSQVQITGVRVDATETGLSVVLETAAGALSLPMTETEGNAVIAEIPDAVLALPDGDAFEAFGPAEGIALVSVAELPEGGVRVSITGTDAPPQAEIRADAGTLVLSVEPGVATAADADEDAIQVVVTATRTEEEIFDVPRSVTVITREELEQQTNLTTNLQDILGQTVPGLGAPTQSFSNVRQTLRGRSPQILIDGVPMNSNFTSFNFPLRGITPSAIERIEVVRGPSAAFGEGATGGVINIITRRPTEELTQTFEARVNTRGDFEDESFGTYLEYGLSGTDGPFDVTVNTSWETFGFAFDGAGDQIPGEERSLENGRTLSILGRLGWDINEEQRLQLSVNHADDETDAEFITDRTVAPDVEKARALRAEFDCIDFDCGDDRTYTTVSLNYNHDNIFGSQLRLQGFFRRNFNFNGFPFQLRGGSFPGRFSVIQQDSERFGGRLEIETPFSEAFNLLWGVDYSSEEVSQTRTILDEVGSIDQRTQFEFGQEEVQSPPYTVENLGLFAQAQWDITPRWLVSGGVRYENIGLQVDDYTVGLFFNPPISVEGGRINADDVVFNIGTVYDLTDELNVFASFSQGLGVPEFGRVFRAPPAGFRSLEDDLEFTAPQKVNNYEIGLRGQWNTVQFSLAGFYNDSELGISLLSMPEQGFIEIARGPQRIYGVEATVDWQPSPIWQLGGAISWNEGENDLDDDGDFDPLGTRDIQPIRITAYVENETLPGWRNRLQALFVGDRDRAFDSVNGPDFRPIESYFVLDFISSIQLGPGTIQIGIQNLLDEEYLPIDTQINSLASERAAAPGRTISLGYRVNF